MKFGLVDGHRIESRPGLSGTCPLCGGLLVAKCGELRVWHWAHVSLRNCDSWSEPEGLWHRSWKAQFPDEWQEIIHLAESGEKHIADVRTARGWSIEFQHSHLTPDERRARDAFYSQLIWVVDATRRKGDVPKLREAWKGGIPVNSGIRRIHAPDSALLRDWAGCRAPVFLDVGVDALEAGLDGLGWLIPRRVSGTAYLLLVRRTQFVEILRGDTTQASERDKQFTELPRQLALLDDEIARQEQARRTPPLVGFESYLARRNRYRGRF